MGGMTKDTLKASANARQYENTKPEQLGNLHERMQYVMKLMCEQRADMPHDVWHAVFDLETEVKHYETKVYSFGQGTWIKPARVRRKS